MDDDIRIKHRDQPFEVAGSQGGEKGFNNRPLAFEISGRNSIASAHAPTRPACKLPGGDRCAAHVRAAAGSIGDQATVQPVPGADFAEGLNEFLVLIFEFRSGMPTSETQLRSKIKNQKSKIKNSRR